MTAWLWRIYRFFDGTKTFVQLHFTVAGSFALATCFAFALLGVDTTQSMAFQIFSLLLTTLLVAALANGRYRGRFAADRQLPRYGVVGQPLTYGLTVRNLGVKPLTRITLYDEPADPRPDFASFASSREPSNVSGNAFDRWLLYPRWRWLRERRRVAQVAETALPDLQGHDQWQTQLTLTPLRRGRVEWRETLLLRCDPLGLSRRTKRYANAQSLLILPKRYPVAPLALSGHRVHQPGGVTLASAVADAQEFVSLRDYQAGDSVRNIHWNSWAKTGRPVVKEFQEEYFVRHGLILDSFHPVSERVFEEAVSVAASFAVRQGTEDALLDLLFVGKHAIRITTGRNLAPVNQLLEMLAVAQPVLDQDFSSLAALVNEHLYMFSACVCVFVNWDMARRDLLRRLRSRRIPVLALLLVEQRKVSRPMPLPEDGVRIVDVSHVAEALKAL